MDSHTQPQDDLFLTLLRRFQEEGVEYVLVGGQAVRLNGFVRATEDVDVLLRPGRANGEKIIRALSFLQASSELDISWFDTLPDGEVENIRVADTLLVDLLFAANGQTLESLASHIVQIDIEGVTVRLLDIDGLLKTKTDYREKDVLDKSVLTRLRDGLM